MTLREGTGPAGANRVNPDPEILTFLSGILAVEKNHRTALQQALRDELIKTGRVSIHDIESAAGINRQAALAPLDAVERAWSGIELERFYGATLKLAATHFSLQEAQALIGRTLEGLQETSLSDYLLDPHSKISGPDLLKRLEIFCALPAGQDGSKWDPESQLDPHTVVATRVKLIQTLLTEDQKLVALARQLFNVSDFLPIARSLITTDDGIGRVGGKMTGALLFFKALTINEELAKNRLGLDLKPDPHPDFFRLAAPDATTITAQDVFEAVLSFNELGRLRKYKWLEPSEIDALQESILTAFREELKFPPVIEGKLEAFVRQSEGAGPFMIRSSSLLEDSSRAPFSGCYQSVVWSNQGSFDERVAELKTAIGEVYASTFSYNALSYRQEFRDLGLLDSEEEMGISMQRMVGRQFGRYFFPIFSGVGMSYADIIPNEQSYRRQDGALSLALGHGKAIVDQVDNFIREMYLCAPERDLKTVSMADPRTSAQRYVWVVDLEEPDLARRFKKLDFFDMQKEIELPGEIFAGILSTLTRGSFYPGMYEGTKFITFDGIAQEKVLAAKLSWVFDRLKTVFGKDVDIEFASDGTNLILLQGRMEMRYAEEGAITIPSNLTAKELLFRVQGQEQVPTQQIDNIRYVVLVRPDAYAELTGQALARHEIYSQVSEVVTGIGTLNQKFLPQSFLMISPGVLGTNMEESKAGLPVRFGDISNAALLIELLTSDQPFHSNGRHWWAALKQKNLRIFPLRADAEGTFLNQEFLTGPNALAKIVSPETFDRIGHIIHVVDVEAQFGGKLLCYAGSSKLCEAVAYLKERSA